MERKFGIQLGKTFIGASLKSYAPFTENIESGKSYILTDGDFSKILSCIRGTYTDTNLIELFGNVAEIFAPIDTIASRVIAGTFVVKNTKTDEIVYDNTDLNKIFSSPNPFQNFSQLLYEAVCYELVTGKNFLLSTTPETLSRMDYKNIICSYNLPPDRIKILMDKRIKLFSATKKSEIILGYKLEEGTDNEQTFKTENILYTRANNLDWKGKKIEGRSPLLSAEKAIANLIAVYEARNVIYVKRGALGAIVSKKSDASGNVALLPKEKQQVIDDFNKSYGVQKGKSPMIITDQPVDFLRIAMSIQELMPFEETLADAAAIYAVLGVPRELMPKNEGATFENQKSAERGLFQNKVIPIAKSWCQSLTNFWALDAAGLYIDVDFNHIEVLQENKKEKSEILDKNVISYTKLYKDGAITYNQWLIALGYEARDGYDKYINDLENVPMAVKIGVGGTQAMQSVVADPNLSEESKANLLVLLFGITIEQARQVVIATPKQTEAA
ncbi:MAG TPA: phage portal protein [Chitinophagaceae bacterium]